MPILPRLLLFFCLVVFCLSIGACAPAAPAPHTAPRTTSSSGNRIVNLYDAFGRGVPGTTLDWGFSALVEYDGHTILFDAGENADTFARNAAALHVDLTKVDLAVLSHGHTDHASGFDYVLRVNPHLKLYLPDDGNLGAPGTYYPRRLDPQTSTTVPPEYRYFGGDLQPRSSDSTGRFYGANVEYVPKSREIAPGMTLVATQSALVGNFTKYPPHDREPELEGLPELSLSLQTSRGEVLIVGCSHSGVETIVKAAKAAVGRKVDLVVGGFHLVPYDEAQIRELALRLRDEDGVGSVAPAHCTGHVAFRVFREVYGDRCLYAGLGAEVPFAR